MPHPFQRHSESPGQTPVDGDPTRPKRPRPTSTPPARDWPPRHWQTSHSTSRLAERARFEHWLRSKTLLAARRDALLIHPTTGFYVDPQVDLAWMSWAEARGVGGSDGVARQSR